MSSEEELVLTTTEARLYNYMRNRRGQDVSIVDMFKVVKAMSRNEWEVQQLIADAAHDGSASRRIQMLLGPYVSRVNKYIEKEYITPGTTKRTYTLKAK